MHVPHPHQAVPLNAVPDVFLHVQVHRVGAHIPDTVQQRVTADEAPSVRHILVYQDRPHALQSQHRFRLLQVNAHKTEPALTDLIHAHHAHFRGDIPSGMVICRITLTARLAHGFRRGFPEADAHLCPPVRAVGPGKQPDAAVNLHPVVQKQGCLPFFAALHNAGLLCRQRYLQLPVFQEGLAVLHISLSPQNPSGKQELPAPRVGFTAVNRLFLHHPKNIPSVPLCLFHLFCLLCFRAISPPAVFVTDRPPAGILLPLNSMLWFSYTLCFPLPYAHYTKRRPITQRNNFLVKGLNIASPAFALPDQPLHARPYTLFCIRTKRQITRIVFGLSAAGRPLCFSGILPSFPCQQKQYTIIPPINQVIFYHLKFKNADSNSSFISLTFPSTQPPETLQGRNPPPPQSAASPACRPLPTGQAVPPRA